MGTLRVSPASGTGWTGRRVQWKGDLVKLPNGSYSFSPPRMGNAVPLFLRERDFLLSEQRACRGPAGAETEVEMGGGASKRQATALSTCLWFSSRRWAEGWASCSREDPRVARSTVLRHGSSPGWRAIPTRRGGRFHTARRARVARVPGTTAALGWTLAPTSQRLQA